MDRHQDMLQKGGDFAVWMQSRSDVPKRKKSLSHSRSPPAIISCGWSHQVPPSPPAPPPPPPPKKKNPSHTHPFPGRKWKEIVRGHLPQRGREEEQSKSAPSHFDHVPSVALDCARGGRVTSVWMVSKKRTSDDLFLSPPPRPRAFIARAERAK